MLLHKRNRTSIAEKRVQAINESRIDDLQNLVEKQNAIIKSLAEKSGLFLDEDIIGIFEDMTNEMKES